MATTFPGENDGIAPPVNSSDIGKFRSLIGDRKFEQYDPPVPGRGNYAMFSDDDIEGFLASGDGSMNKAVGYAYLALAGAAALDSKSVADMDLKIDLTKRAGDLRLIAKEWFGRADSENPETADAFEIASPSVAELIPEGTIPMWGRKYVPTQDTGRFQLPGGTW